jgi:hypothetical protein
VTTVAFLAVAAVAATATTTTTTLAAATTAAAVVGPVDIWNLCLGYFFVFAFNFITFLIRCLLSILV